MKIHCFRLKEDLMWQKKRLLKPRMSKHHNIFCIIPICSILMSYWRFLHPRISFQLELLICWFYLLLKRMLNWLEIAENGALAISLYAQNYFATIVHALCWILGPTPVIQALCRLRQDNRYEFETRLCYKMSSWPTLTTWQDPISKR